MNKREPKLGQKDRICKSCGAPFYAILGKMIYCIDCKYQGISKLKNQKVKLSNSMPSLDFEIKFLVAFFNYLDEYFKDAMYLYHSKSVVNLIKKKYRCVRSKAISRKKEFSLDFEAYFLIYEQPCYYCGIKSYQFTIDRKDNEVGYINDNVVPCCFPCNIKKGNRSLEDFAKFLTNTP